MRWRNLSCEWIWPTVHCRKARKSFADCCECSLPRSLRTGRQNKKCIGQVIWTSHSPLHGRLAMLSPEMQQYRHSTKMCTLQQGGRIDACPGSRIYRIHQTVMATGGDPDPLLCRQQPSRTDPRPTFSADQVSRRKVFMCPSVEFAQTHRQLFT